jgi:ankyrin repeat protein
VHADLVRIMAVNWEARALVDACRREDDGGLSVVRAVAGRNFANQEVLESGPDVVGFENTALYYCCEMGNVQSLKLLIDAGANLQGAPGRQSPAYCAVLARKNGAACVFQICSAVASGSPPDVLLWTDGQGRNIAHRAVQAKKADVLRVLVQEVPNLCKELFSAVDENGRPPVEHIDESSVESAEELHALFDQTLSFVKSARFT